MATLTEYEGASIEARIARSIPEADPDDPFVFLMGPYRLLDPSYLYPDDSHPLPYDPLAPRDGGAAPDAIEATLRTICDRVSEATGVTAFIATDVDIPTRREAERENLAESGMAVIDQSVAFAKASVGSAFVFTKAGLTTGAGAEAGAIPEYFRLRAGKNRRRDPRTFCIFAEASQRKSGTGSVYEPRFSSASIDEMDDAYDLRFRYFVDRGELAERLIDFVEAYVIPLVGR
ncbi:hypothetical protein D8Y22_10480 [Salinadaptatus halalkaliphilus]|uniref:DUF7509 domain-containing protein n=1 Tax=Salinadaptatus halalkaliphilus TaxID=2419781 RepID=A0A4S3TP75_9EURY|nr:hypothetical protein [Salinadaptatus halalkaliphilus]THE65023.1 hypothetical protein D8Y22_10480 [Salinadaptatus halalkaliphilus]